ncbi:hypothetical protein A4X13_0g7495 [Tilletia indica]|uniref:Uncharacterized protein n=1 Tax=Tilletia indica TaxID=43049 RepID=A0A8T8SJ68_9BASI|nr:hypothetical protein A4X13_0g7495 [Tilletia indica]
MAASRLIKWPTHLAITVDVILVNAESIDNVHEVDSTIYDSEGTAAEAKTHVRSRMPPKEGAYIVTQAPPATSPLRFNINDPENMRVRRGIAVDSQAIRYKNSHLGAWILPTERDRDQPPPDPTNSDRLSSSRRTSAPFALSTSASHAQQSLPPSAAASTSRNTASTPQVVASTSATRPDSQQQAHTSAPSAPSASSAPSGATVSISHAQRPLPPSAAASTSGQTAPTTQIVASTSATRPEQPASIPAHNDLTASYQQQPHTSTPYQPEASTSDIRMDVDTEGFEVIYAKLRMNPDQHHDDSTDSDRFEWQIPPALHKEPKAAEGESPFYKQRRLRNVNHPI